MAMAMALGFNDVNNVCWPFPREENAKFTEIQETIQLAWENVEPLIEEVGENEGANNPETIACFQEICESVLLELDTLISETSDKIAIALFLGLKAECYNYLDRCDKDGKQINRDNCKQAYEEAFRICKMMLAPTHPIRLGFALALSELLFHVFKRESEASEVLEKALEEAGQSDDEVEDEDPDSSKKEPAPAGPSTSAKWKKKYSKEWAKKRYRKFSEKPFVRKTKRISKVILKGIQGIQILAFFAGVFGLDLSMVFE